MPAFLCTTCTRKEREERGERRERGERERKRERERRMLIDTGREFFMHAKKARFTIIKTPKLNCQEVNLIHAKPRPAERSIFKYLSLALVH